jgi:hypothetical protein
MPVDTPLTSVVVPFFVTPLHDLLATPPIHSVVPGTCTQSHAANRPLYSSPSTVTPLTPSDMCQLFLPSLFTHSALKVRWCTTDEAGKPSHHSGTSRHSW